VIVRDGNVIGKGIAIGYVLHDPTSHDGVSAIRDTCSSLHTSDLSGATLYTSLQPRLMCYSAANWAGISRIVYGCRKTKDMVKKRYYEGSNDIEKINKNNTHHIELVFLSDFEKEILELVKVWERKVGIV
jgi:tRNA(Arg) A34 adenosine deaminase TadA